MASATYEIIEMLRNLRTRFRRKDTDATRVLAKKHSIHRSPWQIAPTARPVVKMAAEHSRRVLSEGSAAACGLFDRGARTPKDNNHSPEVLTSAKE